MNRDLLVTAKKHEAYYTRRKIAGTRRASSTRRRRDGRLIGSPNAIVGGCSGTSKDRFQRLKCAWPMRQKTKKDKKEIR
jgi:hypothetical protein